MHPAHHGIEFLDRHTYDRRSGLFGHAYDIAYIFTRNGMMHEDTVEGYIILQGFQYGIASVDE